jgi:hypothetical protein
MTACMVIATDREALRSETLAYERAERLIETWAFERRRQQQQRREFMALTQRIRLSNKPDTASTAVFHGQKQLTKKQRLEAEHRERVERERREAARKAALRARRGRGPVRKCSACWRIYRGDDDTCGCRPCAHCGTRFKGEGFKCEPCRHDPALATARGSQTRSFVPRLEAQPTITPLSNDALRIEALLDEIPQWMADAIKERYLAKQTDHKAAENLMIPVPTFSGRARAAVARVAELLAK